jgi:hypothetical protein
MSRRTWIRSGELLAGTLLLILYVVAFAWMPRDVFWHPDEGAKFLAMRTLGWDHGLTYTLQYPGRVIDPTFEFYAGHCGGGQVYPQPEPDGGVHFRWPIWFPLASRPFFDAFGIAGVYVLPLLAGWLSALVAGGWMTLAGSQLAPLAILLIGCSTPLFFYSLGFFEHTLATFFGLVAASILISARRRGWRTLLLLTPFLVIAVLLRVEMLAFAAALVVTWAVSEAALRVGSSPHDAPGRQRRWNWLRYVFAAGLAGITVVAVAGLLAPRQQQALRSLPDLVGSTLQKWPYVISATGDLLIGPSDVGFMSGSLWRLVVVLSIGAAAIAPFVTSRRTEAILIMGALVVLLASGLVTAFASRPYLGQQGLLAVAPYVIVGGYVWPHAWRQRHPALLRLAGTATLYAVLGYLALFSVRVGEAGNEMIGLDGSARYMLTLYPFGVVLSLLAIERVRASDRPQVMKSAFTILVAAMVIASCVYELRGLREMRTNRLLLAAWDNALRTQDRVVTDVWWLPAALAPLSTTKEMYCVDDASRFPEWMARAKAHGARSFAFSTNRRLDEEHFDAAAVAAAGFVADRSHVVDGLSISPFHLLDRRDHSQ